MPHEFVYCRVVGQITAALTGDAQFAAQAFHFFHEQDVFAPERSLTGSHNSRGSAADDNDIVICLLFIHRA